MNIRNIYKAVTIKKSKENTVSICYMLGSIILGPEADAAFSAFRLYSIFRYSIILNEKLKFI